MTILLNNSTPIKNNRKVILESFIFFYLKERLQYENDAGFMLYNTL